MKNQFNIKYTITTIVVGFTLLLLFVVIYTTLGLVVLIPSILLFLIMKLLSFFSMNYIETGVSGMVGTHKNLTIINITGTSRSGKDTCMDILSMHMCTKIWHKVAIADTVKEVAILMGWNKQKDHDGRILLLRIGYALKSMRDFQQYDPELEKVIVDTFNQHYPQYANIKRNVSFWTNVVVERIHKIKETKPFLKVVFVTDMRFEDEFRVFTEYFPDMYNIRIIRDVAVPLDADMFLDTLTKYCNHNRYYVVENNSDIQTYYKNINAVHKKIDIILELEKENPKPGSNNV